MEGVVRVTDAVGARVLALEAHAGKTLGVVSFGREEFDAVSLATQLGGSEWARSTGTTFEAIPLPGVLEEGERRYPLAALCKIFDDESRLAQLQSALLGAQKTRTDVSAFLTGPWLGDGISSIGSPTLCMGETLSPPAGAFGRRFLRARSEWCTKKDIEILGEKVVEVTPEEGAVRVESVDAQGQRASRFADAVIIATGGLVGGGVALSASESGAHDLGPQLGAALAVPSGARDGWDPVAGSGSWIAPPHGDQAGPSDGRIGWAGDVRTEVCQEAPGGTVLGAAVSGFEAAVRFVERG
jgi:hypothetical protein